MVYRVIGTMSGSSLDGLDIVFVELEETSGKWKYNIGAASCLPYADDWKSGLLYATQLTAIEYQRLHTAYGHFTGSAINKFIADNDLHHQVQLIASHGHTVFHEPWRRMTAQLGDGAAIASTTGINVVSDLRAMDVALGGQGAPIVPIGERLLLGDYDIFLNLGGIANVSFHRQNNFVAFDVCPANRVLNMLAEMAGAIYDGNGEMAASGSPYQPLLDELNALPYYHSLPPKSLPNSFGTNTVFPMLSNLPVNDALRTYVEHIAVQVTEAILSLDRGSAGVKRLLVCGGGAHNEFLMTRISALLPPGVEIVIPDATLIDYKEALIMALIGVLRWREENNVMASVTGASRDSIGGAVWIGQAW